MQHFSQIYAVRLRRETNVFIPFQTIDCLVVHLCEIRPKQTVNNCVNAEKTLFANKSISNLFRSMFDYNRSLVFLYHDLTKSNGSSLDFNAG